MAPSEVLPDDVQRAVTERDRCSRGKNWNFEKSFQFWVRCHKWTPSSLDIINLDDKLGWGAYGRQYRPTSADVALCHWERQVAPIQTSHSKIHLYHQPIIPIVWGHVNTSTSNANWWKIPWSPSPMAPSEVSPDDVQRAVTERDRCSQEKNWNFEKSFQFCAKCDK